MQLSDLDFIRLLPQFMRDDEAVKGLAAGIDDVIPNLNTSLRLLSTWDQIDNLPEDELDALAWELNITWYDYSATILTKRDLIKNSDMVYKRLGTVWAVQNIITSYFGDGEVEEWWEYDGEPGHFRVTSPNPSISGEQLSTFLTVLEKVKRASAKLDEIVITLSAELQLCTGMAVHDISTEQYAIGATLT